MDLINKGRPGIRITLTDADRQFRLRWRKRKTYSIKRPNVATINIKLQGSGFAEIMRENGYLLDEANPEVELPVTLRLGHRLFTTELPLRFGSTKLKSSDVNYSVLWNSSR